MAKKPAGYWRIKENCFKEAKKYNTLKDFTKNCNSAYDVARINGWLEEMPWLERCDRKTLVINTGREREVAQYTIDGKFIKIFKSIAEAKNEVGGNVDISGCCKNAVSEEDSGRKVAGGYRWVYVEDMCRAEELFKNKTVDTNRKKDGFYRVKENCIETARGCKSIKELREKSNRCYSIMLEEGWLEECPWLEKDHSREKQRVAQYTLDGQLVKIWDCMDEAGLFFKQKSPGHISQCCHFKRVKAHGYRWLFERDMDRAEELFSTYKNKLNQKPGGYTEEEVREEAKKYKSLYDFSNGSHYYYRAARRMEIINDLDFPERVQNPYTDKSITVYVYEFNETNSAYVGITDNKKRRKTQHKNADVKHSAVKKHSVENGIPIPDPKYVEENIYPLDAGDREDYWRNKYKEEGWNVLNKGKTGKYSSSIGSLRKISDKKILEAASQYTYLKDFRSECAKMYAVASYRGILDSLGLIKSTGQPQPQPVIAFNGLKVKAYPSVAHTRNRERFSKMKYGVKRHNGYTYYKLNDILN